MATAIETLLKRDRLVVIASLVLLALLAWAYLFHLAAGMAAMGDASSTPTVAVPAPPTNGMGDMPGMEVSGSPAVTAPAPPVLAGLLFLAAMWMVMMVGMMLPSAAPVILLFAALERKRQAAGPYGRTILFMAGYFLVWAAFSLVAAAAQPALSRAGFMSMAMSVTSSVAGGIVFVIAGIYEFTPFKDRCLALCRSPLDWIAHHHRTGAVGALRMGASHGLYCVGCCWMLMLLLFVGGVMNLLWVAAIAGVVLVEKLLPRGPIAARVAGAVLVIAGLALIARPMVLA